MTEPHIVRYDPAGFAIWSDDVIRWAAFCRDGVAFQAKSKADWVEYRFKQALREALAESAVPLGDADRIAECVVEVLESMKEQ